MWCLCCIFFFFQAEDGIRDHCVTGVQTCALPISVTGATATCVALNNAVAAGTATVGTWSPVVITVPSGQYLTISLTNNLTFTPTGATTPNTVPTSLVIVGQLGGGLGILGQRTATEIGRASCRARG